MLKNQFFPETIIHNRIRALLETGHDEIDQVFDYLLQATGKMLRPRLAYLGASFYPHDSELLCDAAVSVELIHLASLIHDDVIDNSRLRRGQESMNARWGEKISVLAGDYLFASAFHLIGQTGNCDILETVSSTIKCMCGGEIRQLNQNDNLNLTQDEYLDKCFAKTACLFACACKVGAITSEMPADERQSLERFGLCAGYAYQVIDDVLDFTSNSQILGKPVGGDLLEGNLTLPVLIALEDPVQGAIMRSLLSKGRVKPKDLPRIIRVLQDSQALENSMRWARAFLQQGREYLNHLPDNQARLELHRLAQAMLNGYQQSREEKAVENLEA